MKTRKSEIRVGQTILLGDGTIDRVEEFDGSFYFLKESDEPYFAHTIVDEIVTEEKKSPDAVIEETLMDLLDASDEEAETIREEIVERLLGAGYTIQSV